MYAWKVNNSENSAVDLRNLKIQVIEIFLKKKLAIKLNSE
jgi:hypothetical protein